MIVVVGESLVDLVPSGTEQLKAHCGGSPFNTASALARLGQPVSFLGCISDDALGGRLRAKLSEDGVALDSVIATSLPTTLAFADLDGHGSARYHFSTEGTSAAALTATAALAFLPAEFDTLLFGGLGLVLEPMATAVTAVVEADASTPSARGLRPQHPSLIDRRPRALCRPARACAPPDRCS